MRNLPVVQAPRRLLLTLSTFAVAALVGCGPGEIGALEEQTDEHEHFDSEGLGASEQEISVDYPEGKQLQTLSGLNLRSAPSRSAEVLLVIPKFAYVTTARAGWSKEGFYEVRYENTVGWAYGPYLQSESSNLLKSGLYPDASDALARLEIAPWRIAQTIGKAKASAGSHARDGSSNGSDYSAATDIWVSGMSGSEIRSLLEELGQFGFAAWYRQPGYDGWPRSQAPHIHAIYAGAPEMKEFLVWQVQQWLAGRTGLTGNHRYDFYSWSDTAVARVKRHFNEHH